ncbi:MAG: zinc-binding dehydrogenase [Candidatus Bathyarchaeota archaeon]|nr:MAG: zinc-binding dehydrogenase [Candidatus Bathyarchaeota archaeon]
MTIEKMRAAMLYGVKDLRVEDVEKPKASFGEVLTKIKAATTCGTDLKIFQRGYVEKVIKLPTIFGHEWAGEVVEVGEGVTWPKKGMRIRAGNSAPCLRCRMCQKGKFNLCESMLWLWGAYAEYIRIPSQMILVNAQEIPPHVSYEEAAMTEPLACVLHGAEEANIQLGNIVAIIGAGPIGLFHLLVAKKLGATVIISDLVNERLEFAKRLGADETISAKTENAVEKVKNLTAGNGADVVIEAIGLRDTWEQAMEMVSKGGTVLEFGGCSPGTRINIDAEPLHYGEVTIMGVFHATPRHFKSALNLIASGVLNVKPLVTKRVKLDGIEEAFETLASSKSDIKIAITP